MKIAVVGGGVSGIRAALTLARAGHAVTLIEKNRHLGGRVFSFPTPDFGEIDIGQHVWLKCCTALEQLIRDLKVPPEWVYHQAEFCILYRRPGKPPFRLQSAPLPGLLHLLPDLLRFPGMNMADVGALMFGMARARAYSARALEDLDAMSFASWLTQYRQPRETVARLWQPLVLAVCNQRAEDVSARHALFTFRESLLKSRHAADICFFHRPLSDIFDRQARQEFQRTGVELLLGTLVQSLQPGSPPTVTLSGQEPRSFDRVILALPGSRMKKLLPHQTQLPQAPADTAIAGLLVKLNQPVMKDLFFAALESPIQWVFNKTAIWYGRNWQDGCQILELIISGAEEESRRGGKRVAEELLPALGRLLPGLKPAMIRGRRFVQHGAATFAVSPGGERRRLPPTLPDLPGIVLAGDALATGWPSTMESGVRAGERAAAVVLLQNNSSSRRGRSAGPSRDTQRCGVSGWGIRR